MAACLLRRRAQGGWRSSRSTSARLISCFELFLADVREEKIFTAWFLQAVIFRNDRAIQRSTTRIARADQKESGFIRVAIWQLE